MIVIPLLVGYASVALALAPKWSFALVLAFRLGSDVIAAIREIAGVTAVATSPSVLAALRAAGARRLCVATPYSADMNARLKAYLEKMLIRGGCCRGG